MTKKHFYECLDYCEGTPRLIERGWEKTKLFCEATEVGETLTWNVKRRDVRIKTTTLSVFRVVFSKGRVNAERAYKKYQRWLRQYLRAKRSAENAN